jgi:hypothetical protein
MSRAWFILCCVCLVAASQANLRGGATQEDAVDGENAGLFPIDGVALAADLASPMPSALRPRHAIRHRRVELMLTAESDDVDAESLRSKEALQAHPYWRVNERRPRMLGNLHPVWAHNADFFPNTLHVRLQI